MARSKTKLTPLEDRSFRHDLRTEEYPDIVSINLDGENPNEITVVEVDDTPEEDRDRPREIDGPSLADQEDDLRDIGARTKKRIDRLKFETHTERRAREAAERERDAAVEHARAQQLEIERLRKAAESGGTALANSMKAEREARIADARRRLSQAHTDGDTEALATATSDLAQANAELAMIVSRTPARNEEQPRQQAQPQRQEQAPQLAANAAAWINYNPWFNRDKARTEAAMAVHRAVITRGVRPEDDAYIKELDKGMKALYPDHKPYPDSSGSGTDDEVRSTPRRTNAVAEGAREQHNPRPNPRVVELKASERAIARQLGLSDAQYAASKLKLANRTGA